MPANLFGSMFGGALGFTTPWVLGFLAVLPALWWLLRLTPPAPRKMVFPALALLRDIITPEQTPARTPWWILLLRAVIAALLIIAFAGPVLNPQTVLARHDHLLIVIDNDWAAARAWDTRQKALHDRIHDAERQGRDILLLPTAPAVEGGPLKIIGPLNAKAAYGAAADLQPEPWPAHWQEATQLVQAADRPDFEDSIWMASGLGGVDTKFLYQALQKAGDVTVLSDAIVPVYLLAPPEPDDDHLKITVRRAATDSAATLSVLALASDGERLAELPILFNVGAATASAPLDVPLDVRNRIARFEIAGPRTAATAVLLDGSWEKRPVGLVGDAAGLAQHSLLSDLFYIDRALKPYADLHVDSLDQLLKQNLTTIILPDSAPVADEQKAALTAWIKQGGVLLRFAGPHMAAAATDTADDFLPVNLRNGDRAMGGALSWATPQKLRAFPDASPFRGLSVPDDVTVSRQVLAEPTEDLAAHSWASLSDGTPLVTDRNMGQGLIVLFHVPARSDWSNLPLSGLFVDMLRRVVDLGRGVGMGTNYTNLPPLRALDAYGEEHKPGVAAEALPDSDKARVTLGPQHPPGLYGNDAFNVAFNLGDALTQPEPLAHIDTADYARGKNEIEGQPYLLLLCFALLMADFALSLFLRGFVTLPRSGVRAAAIIIALSLLAAPARADVDPHAVDLTAQTPIAYIQTGNAETDRLSQQGLTGLAQILQQRTSIDKIAVMGVDPDRDDLAFYPLLYWPLIASAQPLSPSGAEQVNKYLRHGGMILLDAMNGEPLPPALMRHILAGVDLPPLEPVPQEHVLKHSFYLLDNFPGRYAAPDFWLEPEDMSSYDGVATVLYGVNGWAAAWAMDDQGRPLYPCMPNGEEQREYAYRFGVNLVMYALTGNYKSDQMHAQALLKRLGK